MAGDSAKLEVLQANQELLNAIGNGDWSKYEELCDGSLTAFEPEAVGRLVEGLPFHKYYFDLPTPVATSPPEYNYALNTMASPHVRLLGADAAVVSYVRLTQRGHATSAMEETRVWERKGGKWVHVHVHRSKPAA